MRVRLSHIVLILAGCALSACVTVPPAHVALESKTRDSIQSVDVVAPVRQSEIYVFVPATNPAMAGGGLLGALIAVGVDNVRTSNAEGAVKTLRDAVVDYDFDGQLRDDLKASMSQVQWLHVDKVKVIKEVSVADEDAVITNSTASAVLMADADYHLSTDGGTLYVVINANLFPNTAALTPSQSVSDGKPVAKSSLTNALYRNAFMFVVRAPGATDNRGHNMEVWSANHGALLRASMTQGAAKLAELMAADIQQVPAASADPAKGDTVFSNAADGFATRHADGTIVFAAN
jgi:hypothetical protein